MSSNSRNNTNQNIGGNSTGSVNPGGTPSNTGASRTSGQTGLNTAGPLYSQEQIESRNAVGKAIADPANEKLMKIMGNSSREKRGYF